MGIFSFIIKESNFVNNNINGEKEEKSQFEKNKEYIENLREKIQLDQENLGSEKKVSKELAKGSNILLESIGKKLDIEIRDDFLIFMKNKKLSPDEVIDLLKGFKKKGYKSTKIISNYLSMTLETKELEELKKIVREEIPRGISL